MNSTGKRTIHSNPNRAIGILFSAALFATIGFYASSVAAQQAVPSGTIETFPAGENPWGLAFGGDPTQFYPVGDLPRGVLFDGISIWVANNGSDTVTKITLNQPLSRYARKVLIAKAKDIFMSPGWGTRRSAATPND